MKFPVLLCLPLVLWLEVGCKTGPYVHKDFADRIQHIHTIEVLPELRTGIISKMSGADFGRKPFTNHLVLQAELAATTVDELTKHGLLVKGVDFPAGTNGATAAGSAMQTNMPWRIAQTPTEKVELAQAKGVDGLIYVTGSAYDSTPGRKAWALIPNTLAIAGALSGSPFAGQMWVPWQDAGVQITFVDGKTGEVLWRDSRRFHDFNHTRPSLVVTKLFKRYPKVKS